MTDPLIQELEETIAIRNEELSYVRHRVRILERELDQLSNRRGLALDQGYGQLMKERDETQNKLDLTLDKLEKANNYGDYAGQQIEELRKENEDLKEDVKKWYNQAYMYARINRVPSSEVAKLINARLPDDDWDDIVLPVPTPFSINIVSEDDDDG